MGYRCTFPTTINVFGPDKSLMVLTKSSHFLGSLPYTTSLASTRSGFLPRPSLAKGSSQPQTNFSTRAVGAFLDTFSAKSSRTSSSPSVATIATPSFEATIDGNPRPAPSSTPVLPCHPPVPQFAPVLLFEISPTGSSGSLCRESHSANTKDPSHSATPVFPRPDPPQLSSTRFFSFFVPLNDVGVAEVRVTDLCEMSSPAAARLTSAGKSYTTVLRSLTSFASFASIPPMRWNAPRNFKSSCELNSPNCLLAFLAIRAISVGFCSAVTPSAANPQVRFVKSRALHSRRRSRTEVTHAFRNAASEWPSMPCAHTNIVSCWGEYWLVLPRVLTWVSD
mmetsp:Transcript_10183/g.37709  ORF Transcript_10183/g.37709 Transcript_10183/m.37709 type:complete len:336 (-) Transcript_10183:1496-2503(-)